MQNYVKEGKILTLTAPYARSAGQGALVGAIFGVACSDVENAAEGEFKTDGVFTLAKTSEQAWAVGDKIYWDNSNKRCDTDSTVGQLIGTATAIAANPSATGQVKLNESAPSTAEGPQGAIVALTDSSGYSATHDDTIAATAAITTLTDNTGQSGTHDDTLAATTVPAALTGGESPTEAEHNAVLTLLGVMVQNQSDTAQKVMELVTRDAVHAQNVSDLAQKINELRTALIAAGILAS